MHVVIIGNGITGISCARHIRKHSNYRVTVISAETKHFFSRPALMYIYMGHMKYEDTKPYEDWFWEKNRIELLQARVDNVDTKQKLLKTASGGLIHYDKLVIASGSKPNKFGWQGQDLAGVQGLYSYQDLELLNKNTKKKINWAVIVGGGLIGIELAEMLQSRNIPVSLLVREQAYWSNVLPNHESNIIGNHIRKHGFDLRLSTELKQINDDGNGRVKSIETADGETIDCQLVGLTVGVSPNIDFLANGGIETDKGILIDHHFRTSAEDVYAAGDCAQFSSPLSGRRAIEQVWYTGKFHGEIVAKNICEAKLHAYSPGPWFNSAKFLDIEYQTYGLVSASRQENEERFCWKIDEREICMHFVFDKNNSQFIGMNTLGIRLRHEYFDKALKEQWNIEQVLSNLASANFDPEFYKKYESSIISSFNEQFSANITLKKGGLKTFLGLKSP